MTVILLFFLLLCLLQANYADNGSFYPDYMSKHNTTAIQGIFTFLVFFRHFVSYIPLSGKYDGFASVFNSTMGQLLVTMFLFYSGYGTMEAILAKGCIYVKRFPIKFFKLLFRFDIVVLLYLLLQLSLGNSYSLKRIILSFLCWDTLGNSNWYVFTVLILYLLSWIGYYIASGNKYTYICIMFGFSILYVLILRDYRPNFWYNTVLCYPMGMFFSVSKNSKLLQNLSSSQGWLCTFTIVLLGYGFFFIKRNLSCWNYLLWGCFFVALVVLCTMKIRINNGFLQLLGSHVFNIYILQRIPMIICQKVGILSNHPYLSFILCFSATLWISVLFSAFEKLIAQKLLSVCKKSNIHIRC